MRRATLILSPLLALSMMTALPSGAAPSDAPVRPPKPFDASVYAARREKLMKTLGKGIAVLYARGEEDRDGYRQDSDFYYLTGISEPGAVLVLSPAERTYHERLYL
ncbi:MAG TPA: aminopeptidase P N-terminal domain-containing protein, partial [Candidatus Eisenbacteria bacterium]|nr:aminopeptidase P N-terminal domain-containing protein [Candidatus Eisenbacteria bacterium]